MKLIRVLLLFVPLLGLGSAFAQDKKDETKLPPKQISLAIYPEDAGIEYTVQGEYAPALKDGMAAQVVARGNGEFDVYFLEGGLPGAGWNGKGRIKSAAGLSSGEKTATIKGAGYTGTIMVGEKTVLEATSEKGDKFTCTRVVRTSPTMGAKPPEGAKVLFDASETARKRPTEVQADPSVWKEGKVIREGQKPFDLRLRVPATTKDSFKIAKLHIEFITPFQPFASGQGRGNSGVYVFGQEIQVLDSFGLKGENNECGAFYSRFAPSVNMCLPPLSWQTYDVDIKTEPADPDTKKKAAVKLTVYHNGVKIHENVDLGTGPSGNIHLQDHGNPVFYRNIWLVETK